MTILLHKLPRDIVRHIIPYTYDIQNKKLLDDIKNYYYTKHAILLLYEEYWKEESDNPDISDYHANEWLINDLFAYSNNYYPGMYGFVKPFYNIFRRCLFLKKIKDIEKYVSILQKKLTNTQINIFWGLFTPEERTMFCIEKLSLHESI
jgi:hypothetical protein